MANQTSPITKALAALVVEKAPGYDRELLIEHVRKALQSAYEDGKRDGALEARETLLRSEVAFWDGIEARARGSGTERRNELNELLRAMGKVTT